ncbi:hypothetical protein HIM_05273 [Hirsutella minnesotensis 3608]|uniref:Peroxin/Ferlin domain-containing protein n=1 Tax=Hirsutella minnesotensis 3608 TaxID=1043627 RepID=A0A0F8A0H9_9HYPO|nr:hypothetical protein HIM_05273 [Hirsutella minnesotensis 3608]
MSLYEDEPVGRKASTGPILRSAVAQQPIFAAFPPSPPPYMYRSSSHVNDDQGLESLIPQKTPLLLATPPRVTRALTYSQPAVILLNKFLGLLTWTTDDPGQSFLLLCGFWVIVLYGGLITQSAVPIFPGVVFAANALFQRSGGSNVATSSPKGSMEVFEKDTSPNGNESFQTQASYSQKIATTRPMTIEEIVDTLQELTTRVNILMEPVFGLIALCKDVHKSSSRKPHNTGTYIRLGVIASLWLILTIPPIKIICTKRFILLTGTLILTWHSHFMRASRTIVWRSPAMRRLVAMVAGLPFHEQNSMSDAVTSEKLSPIASMTTSEVNFPEQPRARSTSGDLATGVKATFAIYENQRRWMGLGWTDNLFTHERSAWTDELNAATSPKEHFRLPGSKLGSQATWMWSPGSRWRVEGVADQYGPLDYNGPEGQNGWVYFDNKWRNGRRGQDGMGKWTRRRKWYRDAELVEMTELGRI